MSTGGRQARAAHRKLPGKSQAKRTPEENQEGTQRRHTAINSRHTAKAHRRERESKEGGKEHPHKSTMQNKHKLSKPIQFKFKPRETSGKERSAPTGRGPNHITNKHRNQYFKEIGHVP